MKISQAKFLSDQTDEAKEALVGTFHRAKTAIGGKVDPSKLAKKHPLIVIGSAAILGFTAALFTIPSKEEQKLRHVAKVRQALHPAPAASSNGSSPKPPVSIWAVIIHELIAVLKPILMAVVTAGIESRTHKSAATPANGNSEQNTPA